MKKSILAALILAISSIISVSRPALAEYSDQDILADVLNHLKTINVQTGDLLFWATNEIDSVLIQKFTDGPYSHAGILSVAPDGEILMYDVNPVGGVRRSLSKENFGVDPAKLVHIAVVRYKGTLNREELLRRLEIVWIKKSQIQFDQSMGLEGGMDYAALLNGKKLSLYCTEFVYRLYEGIYSGPAFYENDYERIYSKKNIFNNTPEDSEIYDQFKRWQGANPVERFQEWLMAHKSRVIISANGILRAGGFEVIYEKSDTTHFQLWALKLLESSESDTAVSENS